MNEQSLCLVRAIRGPVILITVGVLFVFDKFTSFSFSQTWPVLLIVMGVLSLAGGGRKRLKNIPPAEAGQGFDPGVRP
jgi:hypothetical protein